MRSRLRIAFIGLLALVTIGSIWSVQTDQTTPTSIANGKKSVTLVIDFGADSNRTTLVRELDKLPEDVKGWDLFAAAKIPVQGTTEHPSGFVCRIAGWPSPSSQDCSDTPTYAEGYWSYFITNPKIGNGWLLSGQGAAMHTPDCAGYEAWVWISPNQSKGKQLPRFQPTARTCK